MYDALISSLIDLLLLPVLFGLHAGLSLWLLLDAVRRGRGWIRWQVLLHFVFLFAPLVWLIRRRRWPVIVDISRARQLRLAAISLVLVAASYVLPGMTGAYLFQVARVEGSAMSPTLNNEDRLIVDRMAYLRGAPASGDIVMLRYPLDLEKSFVKRVIASGGDEVRIEDGVVFRNGRRLDEPYVVEAYRGEDDWGPMVVPPNTYFVLGDCRNNSSDSRDWGFVNREYVLGRITTRWWPLAERRRFSRTAADEAGR